MKNIRCWDCKYLGVCDMASGKIKECDNYLLYHYRKGDLTNKDFERLTGLSIRTLYRKIDGAKEMLDLIEEKCGVRFALKKLKNDELYHLVEVDEYED